eukprot:scaffold15399_cov108-Skeletonema_dohrnii-CCMP3373.AAC.4
MLASARKGGARGNGTIADMKGCQNTFVEAKRFTRLHQAIGLYIIKISIQYYHNHSSPNQSSHPMSNFNNNIPLSFYTNTLIIILYTNRVLFHRHHGTLSFLFFFFVKMKDVAPDIHHHYI